MKLYNIKEHQQQVSFSQAVRQGLGRNQGLFFPSQLPSFDHIDALLEKDFISRSGEILSTLIGDELPPEQVTAMVDAAFRFPAPINQVEDKVYAVELFHGPTLAFKDFGGRFMAQALAAVSDSGKVTILTATSGDTGAAVAHAFYGMDNIDVVILYPQGKISPLQEKLFCTLGKNIRTIAIKGDFDDCQSLVKQAFEDESLKQKIGLNSANSINISRLMAQICYYFEAFAQLPKSQRSDVVVSVPSGNFGNLTAGLLAKAMGLPIKRFIAATNENDTVPRYLDTGEWQPKPTVTTMSNAMDVSQPNNWPRVEELFKTEQWSLDELGKGALSDEQSAQGIQNLYQLGYLCEPHGAIGYQVLKQQLAEGETGLFLCTAHPAKFKEVVEGVLQTEIELPDTLAHHAKLPLLSELMEKDFNLLRDYLLKL